MAFNLTPTTTQDKKAPIKPQGSLYQVAISGPFMSGLTYRLAPHLERQALIGLRVKVPLGSRTVIGVIIDKVLKIKAVGITLKAIVEIIDTTPVFDERLFKLLLWVARYYHAPIGDVFQCAMPTLLSKGARFCAQQQIYYELSAEGESLSEEALKRAPKQAAAMAFLQSNNDGKTHDELRVAGVSSAILNALINKKLVQRLTREYTPKPQKGSTSALTLNVDQQHAVDLLIQTLTHFKVSLLNGITGSGKTEVYMQMIERVLAMGKQVLILVPEISLTPQTLTRFTQRFSVVVSVVHSKLTDTERLNQAYYAANGTANIIIGTRSSVFLPLKTLGLIVVDEEHDLSYKQQSGLRYHARDVAIMRAKFEDIPIVLGSATPSMESYYNAIHDKYQHLILPKRAGGAVPPKFHVIDLKKQALTAGLSRPLIDAIHSHLNQKHQVLLFLNRRGYAPVLMCHDCGFTFQCTRCETYLTLHKHPTFLSCHHCGASSMLPTQCPQCQSQALGCVGEGTEKIEEALVNLFPDHKTLRIDRSTASKKGQLDTLLANVHNQGANILIGTQMLAKGHHFKNVTMVGMINIDQGLFSADFRAIERMGQIVTQVSGRAGREAVEGEVYIQTHEPGHPLLSTLLAKGYAPFLQQILSDRKQSLWPPYSHLALVRAEAHQQEGALGYLRQIKDKSDEAARHLNVDILGPTPAFMPKKSGYYRAHLLLVAPTKAQLQRSVRALHSGLVANKNSRIRWSIDIDPQEFG